MGNIKYKYDLLSNKQHITMELLGLFLQNG